MQKSEGDPNAQASVISLNRRIVLITNYSKPLRLAGDEDKTHLRTVAAAVVETVHAPPAMTFRQALHFQIPTA